MSNIKKLMMSAAGGEALNVEDVFSTYLYSGTGDSTQQTIVNGIDLAGEGGLVWTKSRTNTYNHTLGDSESGLQYYLYTNTTAGHTDPLTGYYNTFNSDGYRIGNSEFTANELNASGQNFVSWTFRKAPKFFDVVTYTGVDTSGAGRTIAHNLGSVPGTIIIKRTDSTSNWPVYHRSTGNTGMLQLNKTSSFYPALNIWNNTSPTDTEFTISDNGNVNSHGGTYVAYLFAHNDGDGEFGPDSDADIIKCGSYTGNNSYKKIDLGFEPQWVLIKAASGTYAGSAGWRLIDNMRNGARVYPNDAPAETGDITDNDATTFEADGFSFNDNQSEINRSAHTYIYMAIRRGTKVPESATEVFDIDTRTGSLPSYVSTFPVDMAIRKLASVATNWNIGTRVTGTEELEPNTTVAAGSDNDFAWDYMEGYGDDGNAAESNLYSWMWKRAPGYFDVVAYSGNGTAGRTVSHNLGVAPEMMWVKGRNAVTNWYVYHKDLTSDVDNWLKLNDLDAEQTDTGFWNTSPTSSDFYLWNGRPNNSGEDYIAYLFASLPGISKVGSYTGNGSSQTIDCGFSSGARFVLIKGVSFADNWWVFDTARGIVTGNDPRLYLNTTAAEHSFDYIDPHSSGFTVTDFLSSSSQTYIFYAIA